VKELTFEQIAVIIDVRYRVVQLLPCTAERAYFLGGVGKVFIPTAIMHTDRVCQYNE